MKSSVPQRPWRLRDRWDDEMNRHKCPAAKSYIWSETYTSIIWKGKSEFFHRSTTLTVTEAGQYINYKAYKLRSSWKQVRDKTAVNNKPPRKREPVLVWSTNSFRLTSNWLMKSLALSDMSSKDSSSKSYSPLVTLARVSASLSPRKGDRPDNLQQQHTDNFRDRGLTTCNNNTQTTLGTEVWQPATTTTQTTLGRQAWQPTITHRQP